MVRTHSLCRLKCPLILEVQTCAVLHSRPSQLLNFAVQRRFVTFLGQGSFSFSDSITDKSAYSLVAHNP